MDGLTCVLSEDKLVARCKLMDKQYGLIKFDNSKDPSLFLENQGVSIDLELSHDEFMEKQFFVLASENKDYSIGIYPISGRIQALSIIEKEDTFNINTIITKLTIKFSVFVSWIKKFISCLIFKRK